MGVIRQAKRLCKDTIIDWQLIRHNRSLPGAEKQVENLVTLGECVKISIKTVTTGKR